jgi:hypothetical protein
MENNLINKVLNQVKKDVNNQDMTAIEELLRFCPKENLEAFLSEDESPTNYND